MSAVCPACGVAVVPGYAKCPKCHKPLPYGGGRRPATTAGGTVAEDRQFPWMLIAVPLGTVIVIGLLLKLSCGGGGDDAPATGSADTPAVAVDPTPQPAQPTAVQPVQPTRPDQPARPTPDPNAAVTELDRVLRGRRLWASVEASPPRVDVRSGLCDDPGMRPAIDSVAPMLRGGGLTRLRCLAQSGTVVFERDL